MPALRLLELCVLFLVDVVAAPADVVKTPPERSPWRSAALVGLAAMLVGWLAAALIGSSIAARRITSELEGRFAADVKIGTLHYLPPYWLVARDVVLTSELGGAPVEWVALGSLHARLDWLPFAGGSVQLADVVLRDPVVSVVRDADGVHDALDLWRADAPQGKQALLPVRHVTAEGARLVIRDRTTPSAPPLETGAFALHLDASAPGGQLFACTLEGGDVRLGLASAGTLDLAQRTIALTKLDANVGAGSADAQHDASTVAWLTGASGSIDLASRTGRLAGGSVLLGGEPALTLDDVHATVALGTGRVDATDAGARVAGGSVNGKLAFTWGDVATWQASGNVVDLNLAQLAPRFPELGGRSVQGKLTGRGSFSGIVTSDASSWLDALRGEGTMRAREGRFYQVPLIAKLLEQSNFASQAATLSNAAATFRIDTRTIHFDNAALGSASVGVQGQGDVGFDGRLVLEMVVVPLGSWQAQVQRSNVPVVGDALASLAGKVQSLFGKASALVYQFRISGTVEDPKLVAVPVPVLTNTAAAVFGRMVTVGWDGDVLGK